jgi:hypothetical protein
MASRTIRYRGYDLDILALSKQGGGWVVMIWPPGGKKPTILPGDASEEKAIEAARAEVDRLLEDVPG